MLDKLTKQEVFLHIWKNRHDKENMEQQHQDILKAMEDHKEYHHLWESENIYAMLNRKQQENPFLHITLHSILQRQIEDGKPEEVVKAFTHLTTKKNLNQEKAMHSMMLILADEMFAMMKEKRAFDEENYKKRINKFLSM